MILDDQREVSAFLGGSSPQGGGDDADIIDTHISRVFLVGDRAYKLKRAVRLPYADFSTPEIRLAICRKEFDLNAPTAPGLYIAVRRITRTGEGLAFDGEGPLVDAVVEMVRFEQDALFDRIAAAGRLTAAQMTPLAHSIEAFHDQAPISRGIGGAANMRGVLDINRAGFATSRVFSRAEVRRLDTRLRRTLSRHAGWLDRRARAGAVRRCHGDLHLRNICLFEGRPLLFDCLEFNDTLATVDVLYDLAFLLMDLWHRDLGDFANLLANRYFDETGTDDGYGLLPFFMAVRAEVRAHVIATASVGRAEDDDGLRALARSYFELAEALLCPKRPLVIALGGFSGSGKSTIAATLAARLGAAPGARILESDRTRKAMFAVSPEAALPQEAYAPEVSDEVYCRLGVRARALAAGGATVLLGAVFDRPDRRAALEATLHRAGVPFAGFWLDAAPDALRARIAGRDGGASDATLDVLETQLARDTGPLSWRRVDANGTVEETTANVLSALSA